jgi:hypothetical protein
MNNVDRGGVIVLFVLYILYTDFFFVTRLIINKINKVQWVDFKLENVLVSLHSLKTMGPGSIIFKEWRVTWTFSYTYWPGRFLAHLAIRPCELLSSLFIRRPSVNISHFNLLPRNHWANCNQTLVEWSLDGPLPKLCPVIPTSNQDGRQVKNRPGQYV